MEFWSAEIKGGQEFPVTTDKRSLLLKYVVVADFQGKLPESVWIQLTVDGMTHDIAKFNPRKRRQQQLPWSIGSNCTISHNLEQGTIHMYGWRTVESAYRPGFRKIGVSSNSDDEDVDEDEDEDEDETQKNEEGKNFEEARRTTPRRTPTLEICMLHVVTEFKNFEEGSWRYMKTLEIFQRSSYRVLFMSGKTPATRLMILSKLLRR